MPAEVPGRPSALTRPRLDPLLNSPVREAAPKAPRTGGSPGVAMDESAGAENGLPEVPGFPLGSEGSQHVQDTQIDNPRRVFPGTPLPQDLSDGGQFGNEGLKGSAGSGGYGPAGKGGGGAGGTGGGTGGGKRGDGDVTVPSTV